MSGATLKDLSKYHQGAMQYFKNGLVSKQNRLYAQTEEAGAVSFWPLGGTPLEGKVKFSFKETPPASGDKGPENPSAIAGVSEVNIVGCGENLIPYPYTYSTRTISGVTFTVGTDGSVTANGTATARIVFWLDNPYGYPLYKPGVNYILSGAYNAESGTRIAIDFGITTSYAGRTISNYGGEEYTSFTVDKDYAGRIYILVNNGTTVTNSKFYPKIQVGNTPTEYDLGIAKEIATISLNDTYYGGEIDLATGLMTVTHVGFQPSRTYLQSSAVVATGTQNLWQIYLGKISSLPANTFNYNDAAGYGGADYRCNYFQWDRTGNTKSFHTSGGFVYASFEGATAEEARQNCLNLYDTAVANNNPLTIVYPLATPFTVQLTPLQLTALAQKDKYTPRMNTVYTDADSIQIRYRKSLIHDEDEKVQAIVALGGNV